MNRLKTCISIVLTASLVLACFPLSVQFKSGKFFVQEEKANAIVPIAGAAAFIAECAAACGMTSSQFVATIVGVSTMATGMGFAKEEGVSLGNSLGANLGHLVDAADYPPWETLTEEQQALWGSKENYDASKFNSLMAAFGLGDARDRFYSSGGSADFEFSTTEQERLQQIANIGSNWINGLGNSISSLFQTQESNSNDVYQNYFGNTSFKEVYKEDYSGWPDSLPNTLKVNKGTSWIQYYTIENRLWYRLVDALDDVYWINFSYIDETMNLHCSGFVAFSKQGFKYAQVFRNDKDSNGNLIIKDPPASSYSEATKYKYNNQDYYLAYSDSGTRDVSEFESNMALSSGVNLSNYNSLRTVAPKILFGEELNIGQNYVPVIGYPEDIEDDSQEVYYPSDGITPVINWIDFTTPPEETPETEGTDLTAIVELLQRFGFTTAGNLKVEDLTLNTNIREIINWTNEFTFDSDGCVYVADKHVLTVLNTLLTAFQNFLNSSLYSNGIVKVHDEGVYDLLTDANTELATISSLLRGIQNTLTNWFGVDTATDVIGEVDFSELDDKAAGLVDTISTLAPFGAMTMLSTMISILSTSGNVQSPELEFDFNFMPEHEFDVHIDLTWMYDLKPIINVYCVIILLLGLYGATVRLVEMEAAA